MGSYSDITNICFDRNYSAFNFEPDIIPEDCLRNSCTKLGYNEEGTASEATIDKPLPAWSKKQLHFYIRDICSSTAICSKSGEHLGYMRHAAFLLSLRQQLSKYRKVGVDNIYLIAGKLKKIHRYQNDYNMRAIESLDDSLVRIYQRCIKDGYYTTIDDDLCDEDIRFPLSVISPAEIAEAATPVVNYINGRIGTHAVKCKNKDFPAFLKYIPINPFQPIKGQPIDPDGDSLLILSFGDEVNKKTYDLFFVRTQKSRKCLFARAAVPIDRVLDIINDSTQQGDFEQKAAFAEKNVENLQLQEEIRPVALDGGNVWEDIISDVTYYDNIDDPKTINHFGWGTSIMRSIKGRKVSSSASVDVMLKTAKNNPKGLSLHELLLESLGHIHSQIPLALFCAAFAAIQSIHYSSGVFGEEEKPSIIALFWKGMASRFTSETMSYGYNSSFVAHVCSQMETPQMPFEVFLNLLKIEYFIVAARQSRLQSPQNMQAVLTRYSERPAVDIPLHGINFAFHLSLYLDLNHAIKELELYFKESPELKSIVFKYLIESHIIEEMIITDSSQLLKNLSELEFSFEAIHEWLTKKDFDSSNPLCLLHYHLLMAFYQLKPDIKTLQKLVQDTPKVCTEYRDYPNVRQNILHSLAYCWNGEQCHDLQLNEEESIQNQLLNFLLRTVESEHKLLIINLWYTNKWNLNESEKAAMGRKLFFHFIQTDLNSASKIYYQLHRQLQAGSIAIYFAWKLSEGNQKVKILQHAQEWKNASGDPIHELIELYEELYPIYTASSFVSHLKTIFPPDFVFDFTCRLIEKLCEKSELDESSQTLIQETMEQSATIQNENVKRLYTSLLEYALQSKENQRESIRRILNPYRISLLDQANESLEQSLKFFYTEEKIAFTSEEIAPIQSLIYNRIKDQNLTREEYLSYHQILHTEMKGKLVHEIADFTLQLTDKALQLALINELEIWFEKLRAFEVICTQWVNTHYLAFFKSLEEQSTPVSPEASNIYQSLSAACTTAEIAIDTLQNCWLSLADRLKGVDNNIVITALHNLKGLNDEKIATLVAQVFHPKEKYSLKQVQDRLRLLRDFSDIGKKHWRELFKYSDKNDIQTAKALWDAWHEVDIRLPSKVFSKVLKYHVSLQHSPEAFIELLSARSPIYSEKGKFKKVVKLYTILANNALKAIDRSQGKQKNEIINGVIELRRRHIELIDEKVKQGFNMQTVGKFLDLFFGRYDPNFDTDILEERKKGNKIDGKLILSMNNSNTIESLLNTFSIILRRIEYHVELRDTSPENEQKICSLSLALIKKSQQLKNKDISTYPSLLFDMTYALHRVGRSLKDVDHLQTILKNVLATKRAAFLTISMEYILSIKEKGRAGEMNANQMNVTTELYNAFIDQLVKERNWSHVDIVLLRQLLATVPSSPLIEKISQSIRGSRLLFNALLLLIAEPPIYMAGRILVGLSMGQCIRWRYQGHSGIVCPPGMTYEGDPSLGDNLPCLN